MSDRTEKAPQNTSAEAEAPSVTPSAAEELPVVVPPLVVSREDFDALRSERDDLLNSLVRLQADFENYRKRIERDRAAEHYRAIASAIEPVLPVLDDFERALQTHRGPGSEKFLEGFDLIYRRLWGALSKLGLKRIEAEGKQFDPREHQAVERVDSPEQPDGVVLAELAPGYRFHDRVLRPAMVRVAVHPPAPRNDA